MINCRDVPLAHSIVNAVIGKPACQRHVPTNKKAAPISVQPFILSYLWDYFTMNFLPLLI